MSFSEKKDISFFLLVSFFGTIMQTEGGSNICVYVKFKVNITQSLIVDFLFKSIRNLYGKRHLLHVKLCVNALFTLNAKNKNKQVIFIVLNIGLHRQYFTRK